MDHMVMCFSARLVYEKCRFLLLFSVSVVQAYFSAAILDQARSPKTSRNKTFATKIFMCLISFLFPDQQRQTTGHFPVEHGLASWLPLDFHSVIHHALVKPLRTRLNLSHPPWH